MGTKNLVNVQRISTAKRAGLGLTLTALAVPAFADGIDITAVTTTINDGVATVSAIGLAVLSLVVVIKVKIGRAHV